MRLISLKLILLGLLLWSCEDSESEPGNLSLSPNQSEYSVVRGNTVQVGFTATADDGIQSLRVIDDSGTQTDLAVTGNPTSFDGNVDVTIPGNARLGQSFDLDLQLTDTNNESETFTIPVVAGSSFSATPTTFEFTRDGESTVSYSGQDDRLDQVEEIKAYLKAGDGGAVISAQVLNDAFSNEGGNGNGFFSFESSRQLKNKTFQPDLDDRLMENLFDAAEAASQSGAAATNGTAGLIVRENSGNTILVNEKGHEFTQFIEKGLMGTVMYNQIYNTYFSEARIGNDVENTELREGKNYTDMEHHWDEAYGYFNAPVDFSSDWPDDRKSEDRFWSNYSNTVDPSLGTNDDIMNAFIAGRAAIVDNDLDTKDEQRDILFEKLELVAAATAVHYINDTQEAIAEGKTGEAFHVLSEAWAFVNALRYSPRRAISLDAIDEIMNTDFGADANFWDVTPAGLAKAKATLVANYPEMGPVQDQL